MLPWLGLGLLVLFVGGALAAWLGGAAPGTDPAAGATQPVATSLAAAPTPAPAETIAPTSAPTAAATEAPPAPTDAPPAAATTAPAVSSDPVAELGSLLELGVADGRAGPQGGAMADHYQRLAAGLAAGDTKRAEEQLRELNKKLEEGLREGKTDATFGAEAQALLDAIAAQYNLSGA